MKKKYLFIVNPIAGGKDSTKKVQELARKTLEKRGLEYEIYTTTAPMDATKRIISFSEECQQGVVFSCGGDGTFNECVNGAINHPNICLAPFPIGTGNDFVKYFHHGKKLYRNLETLLDGEAHPIDVIDINNGERFSVNIASVGLDARIGCNVHRYSKIIHGRFAYIVSAFVELFKGIFTRMRIKFDNHSIESKVILVSICNGRYYGGGFHPSRTSLLNDGWLEIFIVKDVKRILKYIFGKHPTIKVKQCTIDCDKQLVNVDGEKMEKSHIEFKVLPNGINLIIPKGIRLN